MPHDVAPTATGSAHAVLSARLCDYATLVSDPSVPEVAADWWEHSAPYYRSVVDPLRALVEGDPAGAALAALRGDPARPDREHALIGALTGFLERSPRSAARLGELVAAADPHILIDYHRPPQATPPAAEVTAAEMLGRRPPPPAAAPADRAVVVIPFRDRTGGFRARNLIACLAALRRQCRDAPGVAVTVVECDERPRWREELRGWADHYLFAREGGAFNKSWAVNVGVRHTPGAPEWVCVLDADVLVDDAYLQRNLDRAQRAGLDAFLPYRLMHCLDDASSHVAIRRRLDAGHAEVAVEPLRALVLREPPGAQLWARTALFDRISGFDERFVGWGGEDDDVVARLSAAGRLERFDDALLHLAHPRPAMTVDGAPYNAHLAPGGWPPGRPYGRMEGPGDAARP